MSEIPSGAHPFPPNRQEGTQTPGSGPPNSQERMTGGGVAVQPHQERADVFRSGATEIPEPQSKGIHGDEDRVEEGDELDPDDLLEDLEDLDEAGIAEEPAEALGQERSAPWRRSISIAARRRAIRANAQRWAGAGAAVARAAVGPLLKRREMLQDQQGIPVDFLLKVTGLLATRRFSSVCFRVAEALSLSLPVLFGRSRWRPAKVVAAFSGGMVKAALTTRGIALADHLLDQIAVHLRSGAANNTPITSVPGGSSLAAAAYRQGPPQPYLMRAEVVASLHKEELQEMREILAQKGVTLPPDRFNDTDAELCRFAAAHGLTKGRSGAVAKGAKAVADMLNWRQSFPFVTRERLQDWAQLVRLYGTDADGRPVLVFLLGKALATLPHDRADDLVAAIISNVEFAVNFLLQDELPGPEHITVVVDASGCRTTQAASAIRIFKKVVRTLTSYYPARLARLHIVGLPRLLFLLFQATKPLVHPPTRQKLLSCRIGDPNIPVDLEAFKAGRPPPRLMEQQVDDDPNWAMGGSWASTPTEFSRAASSTHSAREPTGPVGLPALRSPAPGSLRSPRSRLGFSGVAFVAQPSQQHQKGEVMMLPRGLRSHDLTAILYLIIAVAACTFIGQQAGISSPQVLAILQRVGLPGPR